MQIKTYILLTILIVIPMFYIIARSQKHRISGAPPYGIPESEIPSSNSFDYYINWSRPSGPPKVGLQVGHWKNDELPDELRKLKGNTGSHGSGRWEVNKNIANETKTILEAYGVEVDIIPATLPPKYWADVFLAIHTDGSTDRTQSGYKFAGPWRDFTNKSNDLVDILNITYQKETGLEYDPNITKNMRGYYALSWWRFDHAIHPMTTAATAETGFLTNASDRIMLISTPEVAAKRIAKGILSYLQIEGLLNK